jgi:hypothetical protein
MGNIIHGVTTNLEEESFDWMIGASVSEIAFLEPYSWRFHFSAGGSCQLDATPWRLVGAQGIVASSEDHLQGFGLPAPGDSREVALATLASTRVLDARLRENAPDLLIRFEGDLVLELLVHSRCYEGWITCDPSGRCLVVHGTRSAATWQTPSST